MRETDFDNLIQLVTPKSEAVKDVITSAGNPCPEPIRKLLGEISRGSPSCGILQFVGTEANQARQVLQEIADGNFANLETSMPILEKYCPLVTDFLTSSDIIPHEYISSLMKEVLSSVDGVFRMPLPQADRYGPPVIDGLEDFPNHHLVRGRGNYQATRPRDKI